MGDDVERRRPYRTCSQRLLDHEAVKSRGGPSNRKGQRRDAEQDGDFPPHGSPPFPFVRLNLEAVFLQFQRQNSSRLPPGLQPRTSLPQSSPLLGGYRPTSISRSQELAGEPRQTERVVQPAFLRRTEGNATSVCAQPKEKAGLARSARGLRWGGAGGGPSR